MSVSGDMFSNLDNFKRTPLTGPDSRRSFGTAGGAIDREARKLRRKGNIQGANQLSTAAAMQRLQDRDKFGSGLVSRETRMESEAADAASLAEDNKFKTSLRDAYLKMVQRSAEGDESATPKPTPSTTPDTGIKIPDTGTGLLTPLSSGLSLSAPKTELGKQADKAVFSQDNLKFRQGLDRAIGMAKSPQELQELKNAGAVAGISEDQFQKRMDFWNKKKTTR